VQNADFKKDEVEFPIPNGKLNLILSSSALSPQGKIEAYSIKITPKTTSTTRLTMLDCSIDLSTTIETARTTAMVIYVIPRI
jgi:hypothetical protein